MSLATDIQLLGSFSRHVEIIGSLGNAKDMLEKNPKLEECLKKILKKPKEIMNLVERLLIVASAVSLVGSPLLGYGAGKLIDTNNNPSTLKTLCVGLGADIVSSGATVGSTYMVFKQIDASLLKQDCNIAAKEIRDLRAEISGMSKDETKKLLDHLGLTASEREEFLSVMESAIKNIKLTLLIYFTTGLAMRGAAGYHGYKRSGGLSALGFFLLGGSGLGLALAQGFAQPIKK